MPVPPLRALLVLVTLLAWGAPAAHAALADRDLALGFADPKLRDDGSYSDQVTLRAELDDGGSLYVRFLATNVAGAGGRAELRARVSLAGHDTFSVKIRQGDSDDWKTVGNRLYAHLGRGRIEGRVGRLALHMEHKDFRLTIEVQTDLRPLRPAGGAVTNDGEHYRTTILVPRGRLTGTIVPTKGAPIEFSGRAYADLRQGNIQPDDLGDRWIHLLHIGTKSTFAASALSRPDAKGRYGHAWMLQASDTRLSLYAPKASVKTARIRTDPKNDYTIPQSLIFEGRAGEKVEIDAAKLEERKDDLSGLGSLERFVVERFMQPWSYRHAASYRIGGGTPEPGLRYVYQQLRE